MINNPPLFIAFIVLFLHAWFVVFSFSHREMLIDRWPKKQSRNFAILFPWQIWFDMWVGAFWDRRTGKLYILPLPCFGFWIRLRYRPINQSKMRDQFGEYAQRIFDKTLPALEQKRRLFNYLEEVYGTEWPDRLSASFADWLTDNNGNKYPESSQLSAFFLCLFEDFVKTKKVGPDEIRDLQGYFVWVEKKYGGLVRGLTILIEKQIDNEPEPT